MRSAADRSSEVEAASRAALRIRWEALAAITGYATEGRCRRLSLLRHFGDPAEPHPTVRCCDVHEPPADLESTRVPDATALRELAVEGAALASPPVGRSGLDAILRGSARAGSRIRTTRCSGARPTSCRPTSSPRSRRRWPQAS